MTNCWIKSAGVSVLVVIALVILLLTITFLTIRYYRQKFRSLYKSSIVNYCKNLPDMKNNARVNVPSDLQEYDYELSRALLNISLITTQSNCKNIVPSPNPPGFTSQHRIYGKSSRAKYNKLYAIVYTDFDSTSGANPGVTDGKMLIVFTGTFYIDEWISDFSAKQVEAVRLNNYEKGLLVHYGFYDIYTSVRNDIWKLYNDYKENVSNVFITGHSLGGALSSICAFDFSSENPIHYSFASPRFASPPLAEKFDIILPNSMRIHNSADIVPELPPPVFFKDTLYQHTSGSIPFTNNLGTVGANHIPAYLESLPKCVESIAPCRKKIAS